MPRHPTAGLTPRTRQFKTIKRILCALIFLFLMVSSARQVTAMDVRSCPLEALSATRTVCAKQSDEGEGSVLDRQLAREDIEQLNLAGSSDYDKAWRRGMWLASPFLLLLVVAAFLRSA